MHQFNKCLPCWHCRELMTRPPLCCLIRRRRFFRRRNSLTFYGEMAVWYGYSGSTMVRIANFCPKTKNIGALVAFKTWLRKAFYKVMNIKSCFLIKFFLCPVFLVKKNSINRLCIHQSLESKTTEANKSL